jgi:hypothetical protein
MDVPYSPETIGRHERGDVALTPEDVIVYAQYYNRADILVRYCANCPVGIARGKQVTERDLPFATLRLVNRLRAAAQDVTSDFERIADSGGITECERDSFILAMQHIFELKDAIYDMELYAAAQGIRKEPPCKQERPSTP